MTKIHNTIGCLREIKSDLIKNKITEFTSVKELIRFQNNYLEQRNQIILNHTLLIEQEKNNLSHEIPSLEESLDLKKKSIKQKHQSEISDLEDKIKHTRATFINYILQSIKNQFINYNILKERILLEIKLSNSFKFEEKLLLQKKKRLVYLSENFEEAVCTSFKYEIDEIDRKKVVIDNLKKFIYGAQGEQKVVNELKKLSDEHILINDFCYSFHPNIYNKSEGFYVKSIQIDHLLISPSGIFIIETKNWSDKSLNNSSLFSPIQQIKRANFAIYNLLRKNNLVQKKHHWGETTIPIRNIIALTNSKPIEDFKHVKVLTLSDLNGFINYFKPIYTNNEIDKIADYFIRKNER
ncbi:NERD domain-containing protein [Polaribacter sp. BAL334]|uniref:nuclease-related domain-containing protein n=1 Tax=Polaribacter sp. BAL334 TaxID=1708178 RepID=UPI0018D22787|nr:nuclease-related domain-containing protein [Polaribacter sp. BAL334]MBG7611549.1 NERD domain-containing protein [Polaribacter sp. BAL334]